MTILAVGLATALAVVGALILHPDLMVVPKSVSPEHREAPWLSQTASPTQLPEQAWRLQTSRKAAGGGGETG